MKITIIGANSFLARNFYQYMILNKLLNKDDIYLYDIQDSFINDNQAQYKKIDLNFEKEATEVNFFVDAIFFFIGKTGTVDGFYNYKEFIAANEVSLLNFLELYRVNNAKAKFIYPSTRLVYKANEFDKVKEDDEKELKSIYAITKFSAERYIELYNEVFGIEYIIFRIGTPWGSILEDGGNYGTFKFFIESAKKNKSINVYGDGKIKKTYTHILEICQVLFASISLNELRNSIYNIGGKEKSLLEIAKIISLQYDAQIDFFDWPNIDLKVDGGTVMLDSQKLDTILRIVHSEIEF